MKPKEEIILSKDQLNSLNKLNQDKDFNSLEEFRILFFLNEDLVIFPIYIL